MARSNENDTLSQALVYDSRYDNNWKKLTNLSSAEKKLKNRSGWVRPLSRICEKVMVSSVKTACVDFFACAVFLKFSRCFCNLCC